MGREEDVDTFEDADCVCVCVGGGGWEGRRGAGSQLSQCIVFA